MTGDTMRDLLTPLIGKSGSMSMLVSKVGPVAFPTAENRKLTGVELRADGLIRLERETGWTVIDPREVVAVVWRGDQSQRFTWAIPVICALAIQPCALDTLAELGFQAE